MKLVYDKFEQWQTLKMAHHFKSTSNSFPALLASSGAFSIHRHAHSTDHDIF